MSKFPYFSNGSVISSTGVHSKMMTPGNTAGDDVPGRSGIENTVSEAQCPESEISNFLSSHMAVASLSVFSDIHICHASSKANELLVALA